jgi:hypothetical protein
MPRWRGIASSIPCSRLPLISGRGCRNGKSSRGSLGLELRWVKARYALSWCSWRFFWARLLHSKFRLIFGSMSLRMIVLFIVHGLKKLVFAKSYLYGVKQKEVPRRYTLELFRSSYDVGICICLWTYVHDRHITSKMSFSVGSVMTRVRLPAVRRLESVDPDLLPATSQLLASITHHIQSSAYTLAM